MNEINKDNKIFDELIKKQLKDKSVIKEGFESLTSCLEQGYPTQFCKKVPPQACLTNFQ